MTERPLISVILPVYNTQKSLKRCIGSVLDQSYSNIELIIIDDGSTDASDVICDGFKRDPRVKVFHRRHQGVANTRNFGLSKVNGEYISFLNSNDWIDNNMFAQLQYSMKTTKSQIGVAGRYHVSKDEAILAHKSNNEQIIFDNKEALRELLLERKMDSLISDKLFAKKLLNNFEFDARRLQSDLGGTYRLISKAHQIIHVGFPLYYNETGMESIENKPVEKIDLDLLFFSQEIVNFMKRNFPHLRSEAQYLYYRNLKKLRIKLSQFGAEEKHLTFLIKNHSKKTFLPALSNRNFSVKEKLLIVLANVGAYRLVKPGVPYESIN